VKTPAEVKSAFRYRDEVQAMMTDPDLTGATLLLAVGVFHALQVKIEAGDKQEVKWGAVQSLLGWSSWDLKAAIRDDFPRYEPDRTAAAECSAPMIRRDGPCGKPVASSLRFTDRDPETGEGRKVGFCSRHGALQFDVKSRLKQWQANGAPQPPHNTGGVLRRYFNGDWDPSYRWSAPYEELTDGSGKLVEIPRPKLTLIRGEVAT